MVNRKRKVQQFDPKYDKKFRLDIQTMFNFAEKVGVAMRWDNAYLVFKREAYFIFVLVAVGLLVLNVEDMSFRHFVPLVGTYLRRTVRSKLQDAYAIDIYNTNNSEDFETLIFGSSLDVQEWITKIRKVQRTSDDTKRN